MPRKKKDNIAIFAQKLTELRKARHLTQAELAEKIGIGRSVIGYYEADAKNPTIETLQKFADFFGVGLCDLLEVPDDSGRKPRSRLDRQVAAIKKMPPAKQRMIANMLEGALHSQ